MRRTLITLVSVLFLLSLFVVPASASQAWLPAGRSDRAFTEPPSKEKEKDKADEEDQDKGDSDKEKGKEPSKDKEDPEKKGGPADKDQGREKAAEPEKDKSRPGVKTRPSPIKKLIELKLDQYLVPARALNIPLPGRTQTIREL